MKSVNLKQLAEELNLSIATVSRALSDRYDISQQTKDRVRELASKLNFEPNPYASGLRRQKSKIIGVIIPEVANHFFSLAINGIEEVARANDYHVLFYLTHDDHQRELSVARLLSNGRVEGVLVSVANDKQDFSHLEALQGRGLPLVFFDRVQEETTTAKVTTNDYESSYEATRHLIENGCRAIAHLVVSKSLSIGKRRMQGYTAALKDSGIPYEEELIVYAQANKAQDIQTIQALLLKRPDIDGIFASVESLAMSSYEACRNLGLLIPTDIKVIGFSNLETASLLNPPLTTVTQPAYAIGREAAKILFQAIIKNTPIVANQSIELKSELIVRGSTVAETGRL